MPDFKWWHNQGNEADAPYDTLALNRLKDNGEWVRQMRGNHIAHAFKSSSSDPANKDKMRPFCSVSRWLSIFRVPYFVQPGLKQLQCGLLCRVSNTLLDEHGVQESPFPELALDAKVFLETDDGHGKITLAPVDDGWDAVWQWVTWTYTISNEILISAGGQGGYSHLHLAIKSRCPVTPGQELPDGTGNEAVLDHYEATDGHRVTRLMVKDSGAFDEGSSSVAPAFGANEVSCWATGIENPPGTHLLSGRLADSQRRKANVSGKGLYIAPPGADNRGYATIYRLVASYIQPVCFEIREVYA